MSGDHSHEPDERLTRLRRSLTTYGVDVAKLRAWRAGVDCNVDLADVVDAGEIVVRSPKFERADTSYDGPTDFGTALLREAHALRLAREARVPVPTVLATHKATDDHDISWMLQTRISGVSMNEASPESRGRREVRLGEITRRLHDIEPNDDVLMPPSNWALLVMHRISRRIEAVSRYVPLPPARAILEQHRGLLERRQACALSLLHLDIRSDNIVVTSSDVPVILDFANTIVGDPVFELARMREFGMLSPAFHEGYGASDLLRDEELTRIMDLYALDTTCLLTLVGREEIDDEELFESNSRRTVALCEKLVP